MLTDWRNPNIGEQFDTCGTDVVQSCDDLCVVAEVDGDRILINDGGVIIAIDEWTKDFLERD